MTIAINSLEELVYIFLLNNDSKKLAKKLLKKNPNLKNLTNFGTSLEDVYQFYLSNQSKLKAEDTQNVNLSEVKKLEESVDEEKVIVKETKAAKIVSKIEKAIKKLSNNDEKQSKKLSKKKEKSEKNSNLKRKREEIAETEANDVNNETSKENVTFEVETEGSLLTQNKKVKGSPPKRFQRVDPNEISFLDERLKDNQFLSKGGAEGSYGHKAHLDLIAVKGKDFRKGKDKKKKGSYKGGQIDFSSHSIKFNLDD